MMNGLDKKTKRTLLVIACAILLAAVIWLIILESTSYTRKVCGMINRFGYHVTPDDLYLKGFGDNTSIDELLDEDLSAVTAQSLESGFPAETGRIGRVELMLWNMDGENVMVIWLTDRIPQLVFIENRSTGETKSIGSK